MTIRLRITIPTMTQKSQSGNIWSGMVIVIGIIPLPLVHQSGILYPSKHRYLIVSSHIFYKYTALFSHLLCDPLKFWIDLLIVFPLSCFNISKATCKRSNNKTNHTTEHEPNIEVYYHLFTYPLVLLWWCNQSDPSVSRTLVIEIATPLIRHQFVSNTNVPAYGSLRISITDSQGGYFLLQKLVFHGAFLPFFQYIFCTARISLVTVYKYGALLYFSWIG